jgi:hypothetical protein
VQGFHHRGEYDPPEWAGNLRNYYWYIRIEGRDKAKRRRYYRLIAKEKLRLAENAIEQELILAVCKYLSTLNATYGHRMLALMRAPVRQLTLNLEK